MGQTKKLCPVLLLRHQSEAEAFRWSPVGLHPSVKVVFIRSCTEGYGESPMHPIFHELPLQWFQMRDVGISSPPPLFSVILRISPYKTSLRTVGPVRQKNSAQSYCCGKHTSAKPKVSRSISDSSELTFHLNRGAVNLIYALHYNNFMFKTSCWKKNKNFYWQYYVNMLYYNGQRNNLWRGTTMLKWLLVALLALPFIVSSSGEPNAIQRTK